MIRPLYIVWNDSYTLHNPIIDEQHRALVASINSLYFFIQEGWGLAALEPTLKIVKSYASFHAKTEEGLLAQTNCNRINEHKQKEKIFENQLDQETKEAIALKDPQILLTFLRKWWLQHLEDHKSYADYYEKMHEDD